MNAAHLAKEHADPSCVLLMSMEQILRYELERAGWPMLVSWPWAQKLVGRYFVWKCRRIHVRFFLARERVRRVAQMRAAS